MEWDTISAKLRDGNSKDRLAALEALLDLLDQQKAESEQAMDLFDMAPGLLADNFSKISQLALQALTRLIPDHKEAAKPHAAQLLPAVAERLGDTRQAVRQEACNTLLALLQALRPELLLERLAKYWGHKNWRIRHGMLQTFAEAVCQLGPAMLSPKDGPTALLTNVIKLIEDPDSTVRDACTECLEELHLVMGEQLIEALGKSAVRPSRLREVVARLTASTPGDTPLQAAKDQRPADRRLSGISSSGGGGATPPGSATAALMQPEANERGSGCSTPDIQPEADTRSAAVRRPPLAKPASAGAPGRRKGGYMDGGGITNDGELPEAPAVALSSERELKQECDAIAAQLAPAVEWDTRISALLRLESLVKGGAAELDGFDAALRGMWGALTAQITDRRSAVSRQGSHLVGVLARHMGSRLEPHALVLLPPLLKTLVITVQIQADAANAAVHAILDHCHGGKLLGPLLEGLQRDRSAKVRQCCAAYLVHLLEQWDPATYARSAEALEGALKQAVGDACAEARAMARVAYAAWAHRVPDRAAAFLRRQDASTQDKLGAAAAAYTPGPHNYAAAGGNGGGSGGAGRPPSAAAAARAEPAVKVPKALLNYEMHRPGGAKAARSMGDVEEGGSRAEAAAAERGPSRPVTASSRPRTSSVAGAMDASESKLGGAAATTAAAAAAPAPDNKRSSRKSLAPAARVHADGSGALYREAPSAPSLPSPAPEVLSYLASLAPAGAPALPAVLQQQPPADRPPVHVARPVSKSYDFGSLSVPAAVTAATAAAAVAPPAAAGPPIRARPARMSVAHALLPPQRIPHVSSPGMAQVVAERHMEPASRKAPSPEPGALLQPAVAAKPPSAPAYPSSASARARRASSASAGGGGGAMGYVASSVDGVPGAIHPIVISDTAGSALRDQSDGGHHAGGLPSWKQAMALLAGSGSAPKGSQGWSERAHAFAAIAEHLRAAAGGADGNGGASANGAVQELVKDFPALQARALEALDDVSGHFKVVSSALEAVKEALPLAPGAFEGGVDRLMPALFGKLVDKKDQIRCLAQDTLQAVAAHYTCDVLLAGLVRSLDTLKAPRAKLEILEFSCAVLGQGQPAGGPSSPHHIKQWLLRLAALLADKLSDMRKAATAALDHLIRNVDGGNAVHAYLAHASGPEALAVRKVLVASTAAATAAGAVASYPLASVASAPEVGVPPPQGVAGSQLTLAPAPAPPAKAPPRLSVGARGAAPLTVGGADQLLLLDQVDAASGRSPAMIAPVQVTREKGTPGAAGTPGDHPVVQQHQLQQQQQPRTPPGGGSSSSFVGSYAAMYTSATAWKANGYPGGQPQQYIAASAPAAAPMAAASAMALPVDAAAQARQVALLVHRLQTSPGADTLAKLAACAASCGEGAWAGQGSAAMLALLHAARLPDNALREAAMFLIEQLTSKHPSLFEGTLDILVPNLLTACADGDRGVALAANQALLGLMASMPPGRCLDLLQARLPVAPPPAAAAAALNQQGGAASSSSGGGGGAVDSSSDVLCVAIRCLQVLVQRMAPAELQPRATSAAGGLLSGLFQAFEHSRPDVRKAVVFCLVQIWLQLGDGLKPHLERLSPSQMKLVAIYYEKAARAQLQGMEEQERQGGGSGQAAGDAGPRGGAGR